MSGDPNILSPPERWTAAGWREEICGCCAGIQWGGDEPRTCLTCAGEGRYWVSPTGRMAEYPGGRLLGSMPKGGAS